MKIRFALLLSLFALIGAGKAWLDHSLNWQLDQLFHALNPAWQGQYQQARLSWLGDIHLDGIQLNNTKPAQIEIKSLQIPQAWQFSQPYFYPKTAKIRFKQIKLSQMDFEPNRKALFQLLGYSTYHLDQSLLRSLGYLVIQGQAELSYTQEDTETLILNLSFIDEQLGRWQIQLQAKPLHWQQFIRGEIQMDKWQQQIHWQQAQISFKPGSLWLPLLDALAQKQKLSLAELQNQLIDKMGRDLKPWLRQQSQNDIKDKLRTSIQHNKALSILLKPQQSLTIANLYQIPLTQWAARLQARLISN